MARDNCTWGQRRIANELRLKLGLRVSPHTVRKYMPMHLDRAPGHRVPSQRWCTFMRNHTRDLISSGAVDLTRGVRALSAHVKRLLQRWWGCAVAREVRGCFPPSERGGKRLGPEVLMEIEARHPAPRG